MANNLFSDELAFSIARFPSYEKGEDYFLTFVEWIKTTYQRRRRLMEELQKHHV